VRRDIAMRTVYGGRKSLWRLSQTKAVHQGLGNIHFAKRGLVSLKQQWWTRRQRAVMASEEPQLMLPLG